MREQKNKMRKRSVFVILAVVLLLLAFDLSSLGGNLRFYARWKECGQQPLWTMSMPGIAWYEKAPLISVLRDGDTFCTPIEAERAGYSANSQYYDFPHLYEAGEPTKYMREHGITEYAK